MNKELKSLENQEDYELIEKIKELIQISYNCKVIKLSDWDIIKAKKFKFFGFCRKCNSIFFCDDKSYYICEDCIDENSI